MSNNHDGDPSLEEILEMLGADPTRAMSDQETADVLGISRQAVQQIEQRALRKLRAIMNVHDWRF